MWRRAAAEPLTIRARLPAGARRFALERLRRAVGAAAFFRRLRALLRPPRAPEALARRLNSNCVAGVCCAKPANPPGGTISVPTEPPKSGMTTEPPPPSEPPEGNGAPPGPP